MTRLAPALAVLAATAACGSSAPYTVPAAILNTAVAAGVGAQERAHGGCWAICTHGTVCNPRNGLCEPPARAASGADVYCEEEPGGGTRCVPLQIGKERSPKEPATRAGISPATGTVPPPPAEASPRSGP